MKRVIINEHSWYLLERASETGEIRGGIPLPENKLSIELDDEVLEALYLINPDIDEAIQLASARFLGSIQ